ncbi:S9 family peptidase [Marinitenerispora sediminis]|uniref:S9 family peptidase n=1 Tax=Marinitenerispora sediminis TaxID=1931232 RepID=A0A368T3D7_9ACTN|nr:alpha/beta fold hydrolase [Marinitenerispora sediminis]RCV49473.1 S9 family peptidase [Marinitenerispora sediminis]RCV57013.1 S9 family peptidase [Marinitenerispora sediminis]RCV58638.1 S9 family peptidase [Marinitenerispora sediminis]
MGHPWHELADYLALPRVGGLRLSPDGTRLVAPVGELDSAGTAYATALWEIDPAGEAEPRRLTRSAEGESAPEFLPDGSLLFVSKRPAPEAPAGEEARPAVWLLPADGGEARRVATRPGGIGGVAVAGEAGTVVYRSDTHPGAADAEADEAARKARSDAGVTAILHEESPVRSWDHDLGPARPRLFAADPPAGPAAPLGAERDLTPDPGTALVDQPHVLSPDGRTVAAGWRRPSGGGGWYETLVAIDTATGDRRDLAADPDFDFSSPGFSPDGRSVLTVRVFEGRPDGDPRSATLWLVDLATGEGRDLLAGHELWPREHAWAPDSTAVFFTADLDGRRPLFRLELADGTLTRLTADHGAYSELNPAPDGRTVYALRDSVDEPPTPVRLDAAAEGEPVRLRAPGLPLPPTGRLTELETTADDGTRVRAWLVLPAEASAESPAPLLLWVHGGPYMSWNGWSWRWNPWLLAARGYAVLLPDPALSTGYGQEMLRRAWGEWGPRVFADLMSVTDAAAARDDIDAERTAAMGGSFGGYMANWIAGHTDRFRAVVTHAALWELTGFGGATDYPWVWEREFGDPFADHERYARNSPRRAARDVRTPMLVIHGDKDYRVPVGEGLRLWWDLLRHEVDAKFLYFPTENHWILSPGNIRVWYETVYAFLDHHVLGKEWRRPELL